MVHTGVDTSGTHCPRGGCFLYKHWCKLGTKSELSASISLVTNISEEFLHSSNFMSASVAQKMSWAAHRGTSRTEDIAYCLIGIFDINMPLIYGEGMKAFHRLQEEIIKANPEDYTLFAWGKVVSKCSNEIDDPALLVGDKPLKSGPSDNREDFLGLLAGSPRDFEFSGQFVSRRDFGGYYVNTGSYQMTVQLRARNTITLFLSLRPLMKQIVWCRSEIDLPSIHPIHVAVLPCNRLNEPFSSIQIPLVMIGRNSYGRLREIVVNAHLHSVISPSRLLKWKRPCFVRPIAYPNIGAGDILLRRILTNTASSYIISSMVVYYTGVGLLKPQAAIEGTKLYILHFPKNQNTSFYIIIWRVPSFELEFGTVCLAFCEISTLHLNTLYEHDLDKIYNASIVFYKQEMALSLSQTPIFNVSSNYKVRVKAERIFLKSDPSRPIDILDIVFADRSIAPHWWEESAITSNPSVHSRSNSKRASGRKRRRVDDP